MVCGCCGAKGVNRLTCSCHHIGRNSHVCLRLVQPGAGAGRQVNRGRGGGAGAGGHGGDGFALEHRARGARNNVQRRRRNRDLLRAPEQRPLSAAAINTDYSNRLEPVKDADSLVRNLGDLTVNELALPSLITVTEWSSKKALNSYYDLLNNNGHDVEYLSVDHKFRTDRIQTLWDTRVWAEQIIESSEYGKYTFIKLRNNITEDHETIGYFSVHLPHKTGRDKAKQLLQEGIRRHQDDLQGVIIAGDFNLNPRDLAGQFQFNEENLTPIFQAHQPTTRNGTCKDNFLTSDLFTVDRSDILNDCDYFTHYPILEEFAI